MRKWLIALLKIAVSIALLSYLFYKAKNDASFADLSSQPKDWLLLSLATFAALCSISLTFVRWYWLVRGANVAFSLKEAFRLGFLGYLFNFVSVGIIGGDVLKAVFIARQQPGRRAAVVASVVLDRLIGLYAMFVVAAIAFSFIDFSSLHVRDQEQLKAVRVICDISTIISIVGVIAALVVCVPGTTRGVIWERLYRVPKIGSLLRHLMDAINLYRHRPGLLLVSVLASFVVHGLSTLSVYLVARGLPGGEPSLGMHFVIVPVSLVAGAAPVPGGIGAFEACLDFLYRSVSSEAIPERQGFVIALAYRAITMLIASIGLGYYMAGRREVGEVLKEVESTSDADATEARVASSPNEIACVAADAVGSVVRT